MAVNVNDKSVTVGQAIVLKNHLQGNIDSVDAKANTLVGSDSGKSVRTIANEELAKQLIPENAKESLDTLEELAAWLQEHPDDASSMNEAIGENSAAIEAINDANTGIAKVAKDYTDSKDSAMNTRVQTLEAKSATIEFATDDEFKTALGITAAPATGD